MTANMRKGAINEITSLRFHAAKMGVSVESLIEVPLKIRIALEQFCALHPKVGEPIRDALDVRDYMMECL